MDVVVNAIQIFQKILQLFKTVGEYHNRVVNIVGPAVRLVGSSTEGPLLRVLHEEVFCHMS
jgi:hypothetical protein